MAKKKPNGSGTVTRRKDGRYQAAVYVPQPDGTRARKFVYGKTWEECDQKRRELVERDKQGVPTPTRSAKLSEWLPYWLEHFVVPQRKRTTASKYEMHVRLYLLPLLGTKGLESLSPRDVRLFLAKVTEQSSAATAKEAHKVLRTALTAACRDELISRNVAMMVPPPRVVSRESQPWTLDQTLAFLTEARTDPLYAAFMLAIALGMRRGEIIGLRWSDVNLDNRSLVVSEQLHRVDGALYADSTKNGKRRPIPLPRIAVVALRWQRLRQEATRQAAGAKWVETGYIFTTRTGRPVEPTNVYRSFRRIAADAKVPVVRLHDARHGTATLLVASGVSPRVVMEILGHSQIGLTMNVYTHVTQDTQRDALANMDRLLRKPR
ncbi:MULTISPECIES: site-specific integrase [unclassified Kitasatospora]|uniref:tyrosine-type recombinase/integrase n=1 Tax=unclassified Kitasatospora TaxID=2633591 RepID=UPI00070EC8C4|nr:MULTISPECIES: site-specific integrase [unclassified Kitasatospora]KQV05609.1 integrase [Kitasatospora sp. Root107]KRB62411.1 integrase [Kitasatospora sp. Root187]